MPYDLLTVGDLNLDLLLQVKRFPRLDDEVEVQDYLRMPGGDAANVATAAAKLGMKAGILACTGEDEEAKFLAHCLEVQQVDTRFISTSKNYRTGLVTAVVRADGQRNLFTYRGANTERSFTSEFAEAVAQSSILHVSDPFPGETQHLADLVQVSSPKIFSIDPGAITSARGLNDLLPLLRHVDICFVNEGEIRLLTGLVDLESAVTRLLESGPKVVVVKQASRGCLIATASSQERVQAFKVNSVDATGAGDAFDAGFLYCINNRASLIEAGRFANAVGALTTRELGAQSSQPSLKEVETFLSGV